VLADAASSLPLHVYRKADEGRQRVTAGRLYNLFERPGPATTQADLVSSLMAQTGARCPPAGRAQRTTDRATRLFRVGCMEAVAQMEFVALGLGEDPRTIDAEAVAGFAATPLVAHHRRLLGELDDTSV
jgi:hypothetical protein